MQQILRFMLLLGLCYQALSLGDIFYGPIDQWVNEDVLEIVQWHSRHKRDILAGNDSSSIECVLNSLSRFQNEIQNNASELINFTQSHDGKGEYGRQFYSRLTVQTVTTFCSVYKPRRQELEVCENTTLKLFVLDGFAIFDYMCLQKYDEFKAALPCLHKTDNEIAHQCAPNCSTYQPAADKFGRFASDVAALKSLHGDSQAKEYFAGFCNYLNCMIQCQSPIIKKTCGDKPLTLVQEGVRVTFSKLDELNQETSSSKEVWPKECSQLATKKFSNTL